MFSPFAEFTVAVMTHPKWRTCSRIAATHQLARGVGRKHQQSSLVSASSAISYVDLTAMLYVATRARKGERERVGRRQLSGGLSQVERQEMDISCGDAEGPHPPGRRYFAHLYSLTCYIYFGASIFAERRQLIFWGGNYLKISTKKQTDGTRTN